MPLRLIDMSKLIRLVCLQVIFVDADQVVRADMGDLYDMNLRGRPLAYTPFCDNNKDMDGYRFWRQVYFIVLILFYIPFKCYKNDSPTQVNSSLNFCNMFSYRVSGRNIYEEDHIT